MIYIFQTTKKIPYSPAYAGSETFKKGGFRFKKSGKDTHMLMIKVQECRREL